MDKQQYKVARRQYRVLRRMDAKWRKPDGREYDLRQANDARFEHPRHALNYLRQFDYAMADTFFRPLVDAGRGNRRLLRGPRALAMMAAPASGRYAGLDLHKRVALRSALKQVAAYEAQRAAA